MLCTLFGHSSLAQRGSVLCSAKACQYAEQPCVDPQCAAPRVCKGNGFKPGPDGRPCKLVVIHHKTSNRGGGGQVLLLTDQGEIQLLWQWEAHGRPVLTCGMDGGVTAMFVQENGNPFTPTSISTWFKDCHR